MTTLTSKTFTAAPFPSFPNGAAVLSGLVDVIVRPLARLVTRLTTPRSEEFPDAESVRDYARQFERTDPGFASDLYAAASRSEDR